VAEGALTSARVESAWAIGIGALGAVEMHLSITTRPRGCITRIRV
jgi:hypothetical protein